MLQDRLEAEQQNLNTKNNTQAKKEIKQITNHIKEK